MSFTPDPFRTAVNGTAGTASGAAETFVESVRIAAWKIGYGESLVVVLVAHGEQGTGNIEISMTDADACRMRKEQIQLAVQGCKSDVTVINTACHYRHWTNSSWGIGNRQHQRKGMKRPPKFTPTSRPGPWECLYTNKCL
jgi:hypothetical protein